MGIQFDELLFEHIGVTGRYQRILFLLCCIPTLFVSMHSNSWTFVAPDVKFRCAQTSEYANASFADYPCGLNEKIECDHCELQCTRIYDRTKVKYSAYERWDFKCHPLGNIIKSTVQAAYYVGQSAGAIIFGVLSDRIGRKSVFVIANFILIICGFSLVITPFWWLFGLLRLGIGFTHAGIYMMAVVLGMELVGPKQRKQASIITSLAFGIGQVILGVEAYLITDYRYLLLTIAGPTLLLIIYVWILPESARWLVSQNRFEDATKVLNKVARMNGKKPLHREWWKDIHEERKDQDTVAYGYGDLLKTPEMLKRTFSSLIIWPVVSMIYYGTTMQPDMFGGDLYWSSILSSIAVLPGIFVIYMLLDKVGRKVLQSVGFFIAGAMMFLNWATRDYAPDWVSLLELMICRCAINATYTVVYAYTPELFPTVLRNTAMGACSTVARIGVIAASYLAMSVAKTYGDVYMVVPCGILAMIAAVVTHFYLPETMHRHLPETVEHVEAHGHDLRKVVAAETFNTGE